MPDIVRTLVAVASSLIVILLALDVGLALRIPDLRREIRNPVLWRTLLVALVAVPALAVLVALVLPLGPVARGVIVLMSVSPGAPMMIQTARARSGNVTLAATVAVALTLAALVTLPIQLLLLNWLFPVHLHASVLTLLRTLVPRLIVPLALGAALRAKWPRDADALAPIVRVLFWVALAIVAVAAIAVSWRVLGRMTPWAWLAMLIVTSGAAALGDLVGGVDPRDRTTAAYAVVLGNPAVAIHVAAFSFPSLKAIPVIAAYTLLRAVLVLPYAVVTRRRLARSA